MLLLLSIVLLYYCLSSMSCLGSNGKRKMKLKEEDISKEYRLSVLVAGLVLVRGWPRGPLALRPHSPRIKSNKVSSFVQAFSACTVVLSTLPLKKLCIPEIVFGLFDIKGSLTGKKRKLLFPGHPHSNGPIFQPGSPVSVPGIRGLVSATLWRILGLDT